MPLAGRACPFPSQLRVRLAGPAAELGQKSPGDRPAGRRTSRPRSPATRSMLPRCRGPAGGHLTQESPVAAAEIGGHLGQKDRGGHLGRPAVRWRSVHAAELGRFLFSRVTRPAVHGQGPSSAIFLCGSVSTSLGRDNSHKAESSYRGCDSFGFRLDDVCASGSDGLE